MKKSVNHYFYIFIIIIVLFIQGSIPVHPTNWKLSHNKNQLSADVSLYNNNSTASILPVNNTFAANNIIEPSKGTFLIASPGLIDPNFSKTVVLLIEYSENGAVGLIINRPSDVRVKEIIPKVRGASIRNKKVFIGGPVSIYQLFFMVMSDKKPEDSYNVFDNVYLIPDLNKASKALPRRIIKNQLRIYAGYSGWAPGQLDHEIARGDWYLIKADVNSIFFKNPEDVWPELIKRSTAQWV